MASQNPFHGPNAAYVLSLYEQYQRDPASVDDTTRAFFATWTPDALEAHSDANGASAPATTSAPGVDLRKVVGAVNYAEAIRQFGHLAADIFPLGATPPGDPELDPAFHGITENDLAQLPAHLIDGPPGEQANALEAIRYLQKLYTAHIGWDNDHIAIPEERQWLQEAIESRRYRFEGTRDEAFALLRALTEVELFETFLQKAFPTKYRFSIEGLDMLVPMLHEIIQLSTGTGTTEISIAMAHRGRLNVLAHIMRKPYKPILADFVDDEGGVSDEEKRVNLDDVKYHKGYIHQLGNITLTMPPNPSHLEAVNPVAVGMARAAGSICNRPGPPDFDPKRTMQILIHGDASFTGQGIVAETLNLSRLPGYWTGGTIHLIANNQLGFTTLPRDGRSTRYASDLAKGFKIPIAHVNADHPEACIEVVRIAFAYQEHFEKDVLIDLVGYRRYGHNELDEPGFTQPELYQEVRQHPTVRQRWTQNLLERGLGTEAEVEQLTHNLQAHLQAAFDDLKPEDKEDVEPLRPEPGAARRVKTSVPQDRLIALNDALNETYEGLSFYNRRLESAIRKRRDALSQPNQAALDWAAAEELAFATILEDGIPVRLTGQDSERGTFSHRHAVLHDSQTGQPMSPLQHLPQARASFEIHNSPLSEAAALGFEYGYSIRARQSLVLWEAQYGDFANGAQSIIDEFIMSAREKWGQAPSLVMLLPHGHEGAGPDHSSGRPERFLAMAARTNVRVVNPTTAAQYFHLLRRQALLLENDPLPLIVLTPKSLLRNPLVYSSLNDLTMPNRWLPVIDDPAVNPDHVTRLVFVSGKFYYDLVTSEWREKNPHVGIVRVEQLYPFPAAELKTVFTQYKHIKQIVWAQEEPKNMGAWDFLQYRIKKMVGLSIPVNYVGRRRSPSPAEGSKTAHTINQALITRYVFEYAFDHSRYPVWSDPG